MRKICKVLWALPVFWKISLIAIRLPKLCIFLYKHPVVVCKTSYSTKMTTKL